ncbi:MAG: DHA2 family efflux MFS transporter permease subunit [Chlamydiales bacterium]|nr:DHA2 family efflux MFS transporter permease subunit [Chlamydiales bacterium]
MRTALLSTAVGLVAFLVSLDGFIVNVAIPTISGELGVRSDVGTWIVTVFTMSSTLFIAASSLLTIRFGRIKVFLFATLAFSIFSLLCGLASSFAELLIFRVLQGASVGLLIPLTLTLIVSAFPPNKRSVAVGLWSFFVMVSPAMGPMIGGFLSTHLWPWMFFINVPLGIISMIIVMVVMGGEKERTEKGPIDYIGIALIFLSVSTLQSALNRGQIDDWFNSPFIVTLFVISLLSFVFFLAWEIYEPTPFLRLATFKRRNFTLAALMMGLAMGMIFSSFILDALWVQKVLGYTPLWAGFSLTPIGLFPLFLYPIMGQIVHFLERRIWLMISFSLYGITFMMLSRINLETPFIHLAFTRLIQGVGFSMFTVPLSLTAMEGESKERLPFVISLYSFFRTLCVSLTIPLTTTLWIHREAFYQTRLAARSYPQNPFFQEVIETFSTLDTVGKQPLALANDLIAGQASTLGLADIYYLFGWLFFALILLAVFVKPIKQKLS